MKVDIILMSWIIKVFLDLIWERFKVVIECVSVNNIFIFCFVVDGGYMSGQYYFFVFSIEVFICVGVVRVDGLLYEKVGELSGVEFIMFGVDVMFLEILVGIF